MKQLNSVEHFSPCEFHWHFRVLQRCSVTFTNSVIRDRFYLMFVRWHHCGGLRSPWILSRFEGIEKHSPLSQTPGRRFRIDGRLVRRSRSSFIDHSTDVLQSSFWMLIPCTSTHPTVAQENRFTVHTSMSVNSWDLCSGLPQFILKHIFRPSSSSLTFKASPTIHSARVYENLE